ncbi:MAG: thioredoxin-dependent thiol peroxidase [Nitrospinae bacterium]|nr:thioredoxin-dependent thiol peroxidase [Nitrospinota bacterium]
MELETGAKAPSFCLLDHNEKETALKDFAGKWVVLYFYPKDNTPGCTTEAVEFTARLKDFEKLGAAILGVSADSPKSHRAFIEKQKLDLRLLSDTDRKMLQAYGVWRKKKMAGREYMGIVRTTCLIAPDGKLAKVWPKVKVKGHVDDVLAALRKLKG